MLNDLQIHAWFLSWLCPVFQRQENLSRNRFHKQWSLYLVRGWEPRNILKMWIFKLQTRLLNQDLQSRDREIWIFFFFFLNLNFKKKPWVGLMIKKRPILKIQTGWLQDSRHLNHLIFILWNWWADRILCYSLLNVEVITHK